MRNRPVVDARADARSAIDRFGSGALRVAVDAGVRLVHLRGAEAYRDRSRALRRLASGVDDWPVPPAGLFVVEERTVYLRSTSPMTVAHELGLLRCVNIGPLWRLIKRAVGGDGHVIRRMRSWGTDQIDRACHENLLPDELRRRAMIEASLGALNHRK